jgi:hypothetical protein
VFLKVGKKKFHRTILSRGGTERNRGQRGNSRSRTGMLGKSSRAKFLSVPYFVPSLPGSVNASSRREQS